MTDFRPHLVGASRRYRAAAAEFAGVLQLGRRRLDAAAFRALIIELRPARRR